MAGPTAVGLQKQKLLTDVQEALRVENQNLLPDVQETSRAENPKLLVKSRKDNEQMMEKNASCNYGKYGA